MPYRICKTIEIESGHMLSKHPDKCKFPHGHSRNVEFILESNTLDNNEMVCDFKIIKEIMAKFLDSWDHAMAMNTDDPMFQVFQDAYGDRIIPFEKMDPTTEVMAKVIFDVCESRLVEYSASAQARYPLNPGVVLKTVRVWETSSAWAEYSR